MFKQYPGDQSIYEGAYLEKIKELNECLVCAGFLSFPAAAHPGQIRFRKLLNPATHGASQRNRAQLQVCYYYYYPYH